jgi:hypothetical protein
LEPQNLKINHALLKQTWPRIRIHTKYRFRIKPEQRSKLNNWRAIREPFDYTSTVYHEGTKHRTCCYVNPNHNRYREKDYRLSNEWKQVQLFNFRRSVTLHVWETEHLQSEFVGHVADKLNLAEYIISTIQNCCFWVAKFTW